MWNALQRVWQQMWIAVARNERLRNALHSSSRVSDLVKQYVGGPTVAVGVSRAVGAQQQRFTSSMFYLGEYVQDPARIAACVRSILDLVPLLSLNGLGIHISIDPTAIGYLQSQALCERNAFVIANAIRAQAGNRQDLHCLMLDMEDEGLVGYTIALHDKLRAAGLPAGLTLQAYLFRTLADLQRQICGGSLVRLVKGAFVPHAGIAYQSQREINKHYLDLARTMLEGTLVSPGFYPVFATHNEHIQQRIIAIAQSYNLAPGRFEFEMLLGVRPELAADLAARGFRVRIYVPCGPDWWGYVNRRIGESPRNALLVLRALCQTKT